MIVFSQLSRDYTLGSQTVRALQDVSGEVFAGEMVALCGPSGSGKSTLLNVLGMLDSQYQGQVTFAGQPYPSGQMQAAKMRREKLGFIFQKFNLVPVMTALENVAYPLHLNGFSKTEQTELATQMLDQLTALLRATLKSSREEHNTVENEIALIDAYLGIQKIRLGERLSYTIEVQEGLGNTELPPMMLQPLVENAIIHGIEPKREGGEVQLLIKQEKQLLQIEVKDTGVGLSHVSNHSGSGIGLSNLKQRMDALFAGKGQVSISESSEGGVSVRLSWPMISKEQ